MKTREQTEERIKELNDKYDSYPRRQYLLKQRALAQIIALEWVLEDEIEEELEEEIIVWIKDEHN